MTVMPYLIQRGKIKPGYSPNDRFSVAVRTEYMGSSEFEFGALPKSLRNLRAQADKLSLIEIPEVRDLDGNPLLAYGNFEAHNPEEYRAMIYAVATGKERTKESTGFRKHMEQEEIYIPRRYKTKKQKAEYLEDEKNNRTTEWWDLDNDIHLSFDREFMTHLPSILRASWAYMDELASQPA